MNVMQNFAGWRLQDLDLLTQLVLLLIVVIMYGSPILVIIAVTRYISKRKKDNALWHQDKETGQLHQTSVSEPLEGARIFREVDPKEDNKLRIVVIVAVAIIALNLVSHVYTFIFTSIQKL